MTAPTLAGLCAGAGGLEEAARRVFGARPLWLAENDPYASGVLARVHPGVPNLGDITVADFAAAPRPGVLAAGFPCTDISDAGPRVGITGPRSGVWVHVARAVEALEPAVVLLENVAAIRGRGLDTVLRDLARRGYAVRWTVARASDVGAPHERRRWFAMALRSADGLPLEGWDRIAKSLPMHGVFTGGEVRPAPFAPRLEVGVCHLLPSPTSADGSGGPGRSVKRTGGDNLRTAVALLPTPVASMAVGGNKTRSGSRIGELLLPGVLAGMDPGEPGPERSWVSANGRDYGPAIRHWERTLGRTAPAPAAPGPRGGRRLTPEFAEWMMGWPAGHVTGSAHTHTHTHTGRFLAATNSS